MSTEPTPNDAETAAGEAAPASAESTVDKDQTENVSGAGASASSSSAASATASSSGSDEVAALRADVERLQQELAAAKEQADRYHSNWQRSAADFLNWK